MRILLDDTINTLMLTLFCLPHHLSSSWASLFTHSLSFNEPQSLRSYLICVYFCPQHDATGLGTINTVTAVVTITDVPINPYDANSAVTVKQSFGVQFSSVDTTKSTNVNGNLFFRYIIALNRSCYYFIF